jgi:hypothetical protein
VDTFLSTEFEGGRHQHRLDEISEFEATGRAVGAGPGTPVGGVSTDSKTDSERR